MLVLENEYKYFIKYLITFIDDIGNLIIELNKNSLSSEQFIKKYRIGCKNFTTYPKKNLVYVVTQSTSTFSKIIDEL